MLRALNSRASAIRILCTLAVLAVVAFYLTREPDSSDEKSRPGANAGPSTLSVDESPLLEARNVLRLATTQEEQQLAAEAIRLSDHEVDTAYTMALRRAHLQQPPQTPTIKAINEKIRTLEDQLKAEDAEVERLKKLISNPGTKETDDLQDQLELVEAQRGLVDEELADAHQALVDAGGDNETAVQRKYKEHETLQHSTESVAASLPAAFTPPANLLRQVKLWLDLANSRKHLREAQQRAERMRNELDNRSQTLSKRLRDERKSIVPNPSAVLSPGTDKAQRGATLAAVRAHVDWGRVLADYSKRISDEEQLSKVYGEWTDIVSRHITSILHAIVRSFIWILVIVVIALAVESGVERYLHKLKVDRRQLSTMRVVLRLSLRVLAALCILVVLFGPPTQLSTIIAFAGAGLTVALKDFIVAFFGWFVLMGRNGIHVGDWVEIDGIGGEVVEIGLLRTVLMETGNWTDAGHPTGRQVAFVNSFAMEKHYFNFTTKGQWLWDELSILVPPNRDPNTLVVEILELIVAQTKESIALAEQEWQRATSSYGVHSFSATPAINIRPTGQGITIIVRYITRANERHALRARLYEQIVGIVRRPELLGSTPQKA